MISGKLPKTTQSRNPSTGFGFHAILAILLLFLWPFKSSKVPTWLQSPGTDEKEKRRRKIGNIRALAEQHEVASVLGELIHKDGAGSWPPRANHTGSAWPVALRPYKEVYQQLAPLLPQATPSLDDDVNLARIAGFRSRFRRLLTQRINIAAVTQVGDLSVAFSEKIY
jgi:hypothetical protein